MSEVLPEDETVSAASIQALLASAASRITQAIDSDTARLDAELLLCEVLGRERTYLFTWPEKLLDDDLVAGFDGLLARRLAGEPVAHILGYREFWSLNLKVNNSTLIPRPDTEVLVEVALQLPLPESARALDLGTGTGAIALALASERPTWQLTAFDCSAAAVALAEDNRQLCQLPNVRVAQSDWFAALAGTERFELIVSNPPYIDPQDPHLRQGDVRFEPLSALTAEGGGLADIRLIVERARDFLCGSPAHPQGGWLVLEHGYDQADAVRELLLEAGYQQRRTVQDYGGQDRITLGCFDASVGVRREQA